MLYILAYNSFSWPSYFLHLNIVSTLYIISESSLLILFKNLIQVFCLLVLFGFFFSFNFLTFFLKYCRRVSCMWWVSFFSPLNLLKDDQVFVNCFHFLKIYILYFKCASLKYTFVFQLICSYKNNFALNIII